VGPHARASHAADVLTPSLPGFDAAASQGVGRTEFVDVDSLFDRIAWVRTKYTKQILRAAEPLELMRDREWRCREAAVAERRMDGAA